VSAGAVVGDRAECNIRPCRGASSKKAGCLAVKSTCEAAPHPGVRRSKLLAGLQSARAPSQRFASKPGCARMRVSPPATPDFLRSRAPRHKAQPGGAGKAVVAGWVVGAPHGVAVDELDLRGRQGQKTTQGMTQLCSLSGSAEQASADAHTSTHATRQVRLHRAGPPAPTPVSSLHWCRLVANACSRGLTSQHFSAGPSLAQPWQRCRLQRPAAVLRQPLLSCFSVVAHHAGARVRGAALLHRRYTARTLA
jgi:hypothetical protein